MGRRLGELGNLEVMGWRPGPLGILCRWRQLTGNENSEQTTITTVSSERATARHQNDCQNDCTKMTARHPVSYTHLTLPTSSYV